MLLIALTFIAGLLLGRAEGARSLREPLSAVSRRDGFQGKRGAGPFQLFWVPL